VVILFHSKTLRTPIKPVAFGVLLFLAAGCASLRTDKRHYANIDALLAKGDYPSAISKVEAAKIKAYSFKDRTVYYLDIGMLHHWNGDYEKSNEFLEKAERAIEENFTRSVSRAAASMLLNDNALAYAGEAYEDIYLNAFKALNYLALGETDAAFVEVRRINNKLVQLENKYEKMARELNRAEEAQETFRPGKNHFQESALGRYLSMMLYRNDHKWDDVRIDLEKIDKGWKLQPAIHPYPKPGFDYERKRISPPQARLNVIAFSGMAPEKTASTFYIHTEEDLIILAGTSENYLGKQNLSGLTMLNWPGINAGLHFKFQLPSMKKRPSNVARIEVVVGTAPPEKPYPLESLENAAVETFSIQKPLIYLKTITRAVIKGLASEQAKQKMTEDMEGGIAFLGRIAADVLIGQTENADLRISRFFPAEAAVCEIHLDEGEYDITINYYSANDTLLHSDERKGVNIEAGQLNVFESAYLN
jgi:hypothetical protein